MPAATTKRFTIDQFHRLIEWGFFASSDRVELIRGEIVEMVAKGKCHAVCCSRLLAVLYPLLSDRAIARCQPPMKIPPYNQPEPDIATTSTTTPN